MLVNINKLKGIKGCLAHLATSDEAARRRHPVDLDEDKMELTLLTPYLADTLKTLAAKAFRRLSYKTQVLTNQTNSHVRTRSSHTGAVESLAMLIANILGLNAELCQAMALGHDLGHTPFGHTGEAFISKLTGQPFKHAVFSTVVAQHIERKGFGLNLTKQTLSGILHHSAGANEVTERPDATPEEMVVVWADKIAFTLHDWDDIFGHDRGVLYSEDFPDLTKMVTGLGKNQRIREAEFVSELCLESAAAGKIVFAQSEGAQIFRRIKQEMYQVYCSCNSFGVERVLKDTHDFLAHILAREEVDPIIMLALMTDRDILDLHLKTCPDIGDLRRTAAWELIPYLRGRKIDFTDPDLDW